MERITVGIKGNRLFLMASFIYAAAVFLAFPYLRYFVDNPDTISYITIAQKYFRHDYSNAVNGYWSPLISWMLALLLNIPRDEVYIFKLLQLLIGLFALFNFVKLVYVLIHSRSIRIVLTITSIPLILSYALLNLTPDLLFLGVILFYLRIVTEKEFYNHRHFGLIAGVLGILLYFSKSFGFCFFLAHFTVLTFKTFFQTKEYAFKKHILGNYAQAIICFIAVSSIWIYLISHKYGHFTVSENAAFNLSREVAAGPEEENKLPVLSGGITVPLNPTAVIAWEDPGLARKVIPLHTFSVAEDFEIYTGVLKRNLLTVYYFDFKRQAGLVFIVLLFVFLFNSKRKKILTDDFFFSLLCALVFIYGGYSLILVHTRYIWVCTMIMLLLSAWILEEFQFKSKAQQAIVRILVVFILTGLTLKRPIKEILFSADNDTSPITLISAMLKPQETMHATYSRDKDFFETRNELKSLIRSGSNIVSIRNEVSERDAYTQASLLALASNAKYLGQVNSDKEFLPGTYGVEKIDYLFIFSEEDPADSAHWQKEYSNEKLPLNIYRRR